MKPTAIRVLQPFKEPLRLYAASQRSAFSTSCSFSENPTAINQKQKTSAPNARWLDDVRSRIAKCIMSGLKEPQMDQASAMLAEIAKDWRELLAGSEGFLTSPGRRGLYRQAVVWGEMVSGEGIADRDRMADLKDFLS